VSAWADAVVCPELPELGDYEQFLPCAIPIGSGAVRAWAGHIRPFSDDETARRVIRAIERGVSLRVSGGRLDVDLPDSAASPLDELLIGMAEPFTVLLLEFPGTEHPRTFLLSPAMIPRISLCGHLRLDKAVDVDGTKLPALCVYSGNLLHFEYGRGRLEQLLDQTSTYLAKYLIWLRTRKLYERTPNGSRLIRAAMPGETITSREVSRGGDFFWWGYWPGRSAPSGPGEHLATVRADGQCWCWSGKLYRDCHQTLEFSGVRQLEQQRVCVQFTHRLMRAVHTRLRSG
jgi:hypothetical protein